MRTKVDHRRGPEITVNASPAAERLLSFACAIRLRKLLWLGVLLSFVFGSALAETKDGPSAKPDVGGATKEAIAPDRRTCPPDGSRIALFSRQAFDQGRELEGREYGQYTEELFKISTSSSIADDVVEKSFIATINFGKKMRARGHDVRMVDLIIDREKSITDLLRDGKSLSEISRAQLELQLAIVREMKRIQCR
jgi:hypothetical protein